MSFVYFEGVKTEFGYYGFSDPLMFTFQLRYIKSGDSESVHIEEEGDLFYVYIRYFTN